jgi:hypothetical protein
MLMVVFGAGASFDSSFDWHPDEVRRDDRPPLANDLFHERYRGFREQFQQFQGVIGELVPRPGRSIEEALQRLQADGNTNSTRLMQVTAVRYYLQAMLASVTGTWLAATGGHTVYNNLLEQIQQHRKRDEPVCLVTFNYDTLIEDALKRQLGMTCDVIADYVSHPHFKLFKLHGSTNWGRHINSAPARLRGQWTAEDVIAARESFSVSDDYFTYSGYIGSQLFPAIAIPVTDKQDFECPVQHIGVLKEMIPKVRRILTVGWRGTETHFLRLLANQGPITLVTIAKDHLEAGETGKKLRAAGIGISEHAGLAGFSSSVGDRKLDGFFAL